MSQSFKESVYGKIPEDYEDMLIKACEHGAQLPKRTKLKPAFIIVCCLILIACTALAMVQRIKIVEFFGIGSVNQEEALMAVNTSVNQTGGATSYASFTVSETFYDGKFLRFVVDCVPNQDVLLLDGRFSQYPESEESLSYSGKRYGVLASASYESMPLNVYAKSEGGDLILYVNGFLAEEAGSGMIVPSLIIDILDMDQGNVVDHADITFQVEQTVEALTKEYPIHLAADLVEIETVTIAYTPLNVFISIEFRPLLQMFSGFTAVPEDGYVVKDGDYYYFGSYGGLYQIADGKGKFEYLLPVDHSIYNTLTLWINNSDQAIVIDLATATATIETVTITTDVANTQITILED